MQAVVLLSIMLVGCATTSLNQAELAKVQTQILNTSDKDAVFSTAVNVLQDWGYMVEDANTELGFVSASKDVTLEGGQAVLAAGLLGVDGVTHVAKLNVSKRDTTCHVRLTFNSIFKDINGRATKTSPVREADPYNQFFTALRQALGI
ncbi:MAG: hypothetical protein OXI35_00060 [Gemmatimonadota bacterium]|nr:hypothetical protein [Gemmatimonadota bacterium]MYC71855.1 hypothetical protein [Gemmatimonadota bacterium]